MSTNRTDFENNQTGNEHSRRKNKKSKLLPFGCSSRATICVAICLLCCMVVLFIAKWDDLSPSGIADWFAFSGTSADDFPVSISGSSILENNFQATNNGIVYLSDTSVVCLDAGGEKLFSDQHNFTNPMIKNHGTYSIAYNVGGSNFRIISEQGEVYRGTQGTSINDCDVTSSGIYSVISDQTGYLSMMAVYDGENNMIFSYSFNDYYAISVSLNEKGTMAAVGAVNSVDGEMVSKIYVLDFTKTEPASVFSYNDQIVYDVEFVDENNFAVVTDSLVSVIDTTKYKEVPYSFQSKVLTAYDISYGTGIVLSLSLSDDERDCSVVSLNTDGNEVGSFSTELKIFSVSLCSDKIAFLASDKLYLYNGYGDSFGEWSVGTDARRVILPQAKFAYILGVSEIRRVDLK